METRFPIRRDSHPYGSSNQIPAFVLLRARQVDERTDEGGGGGGGGAERKVRHGSLVSAVWSQSSRGDRRKKRAEGSAVRKKVICP